MSETQAPLVLLLHRSRGRSSPAWPRWPHPRPRQEREAGHAAPQKMCPALPHQPQGKLGDVVCFGQPVKTDHIKREKENRHWGTTSSLSSIFLENRAFQKGEWAGQGGGIITSSKE